MLVILNPPWLRMTVATNSSIYRWVAAPIVRTLLDSFASKLIGPSTLAHQHLIGRDRPSH